jgi:hypothetical protein
MLQHTSVSLRDDRAADPSEERDDRAGRSSEDRDDRAGRSSEDRDEPAAGPSQDNRDEAAVDHRQVDVVDVAADYSEDMNDVDELDVRVC